MCYICPTPVCQCEFKSFRVNQPDMVICPNILYMGYLCYGPVQNYSHGTQEQSYGAGFALKAWSKNEP
jgi:hypothetical protein